MDWQQPVSAACHKEGLKVTEDAGSPGKQAECSATLVLAREGIAWTKKHEEVLSVKCPDTFHSCSVCCGVECSQEKRSDCQNWQHTANELTLPASQCGAGSGLRV